jgi:hypothetical protein
VDVLAFVDVGTDAGALLTDGGGISDLSSTRAEPGGVRERTSAVALDELAMSEGASGASSVSSCR